MTVRSLVERYRSWVTATPQAPALAADGVVLTYAELGRAVDRAADHLAAAGVSPGDLTGLLVERDVDTLVWLLAVLTRGAAYVPLDPTYPRERLLFTAQDAALTLVVGRRSTAQRVGLDGLRLLDPREVADTVAAPVSHPAPDPDCVAYVLYTSGSTGRPKGCVVTHGNVLAFLGDVVPELALRAEDRWSLFHSPCFDFAIWELWGVLSTGACGVVVPWEATLSSEDLVAFLERERISVLGQVPSVLRYTAQALADRGDPPLGLRYVFLGGESVDLDLIGRFLTGRGSAPPAVVNMYGLTETTVVSTMKTIDAATVSGGVASPIGRPLARTGAHVLDPERAEVLDGEVGELWVSGPGLAREYLGRPGLTAERFVVLPVGPDGSTRRCYRTGDLVRRLADGELEYLGRNDDQVKVRGFRVELREIDVVLKDHPDVRDGAVGIVETRTGPDLAGCVVGIPGAPPVDVASVLGLLRTRLPAHMVPRTLVQVDRLPLSPSGKLDRGALARHLPGPGRR